MLRKLTELANAVETAAGMDLAVVATAVFIHVLAWR